MKITKIKIRRPIGQPQTLVHLQLAENQQDVTARLLLKQDAALPTNPSASQILASCDNIELAILKLYRQGETWYPFQDGYAREGQPPFLDWWNQLHLYTDAEIAALSGYHLKLQDPAGTMLLHHLILRQDSRLKLIDPEELANAIRETKLARIVATHPNPWIRGMAPQLGTVTLRGQIHQWESLTGDRPNPKQWQYLTPVQKKALNKSSHGPELQKLINHTLAGSKAEEHPKWIIDLLRSCNTDRVPLVETLLLRMLPTIDIERLETYGPFNPSPAWLLQRHGTDPIAWKSLLAEDSCGRQEFRSAFNQMAIQKFAESQPNGWFVLPEATRLAIFVYIELPSAWQTPLIARNLVEMLLADPHNPTRDRLMSRKLALWVYEKSFQCPPRRQFSGSGEGSLLALTLVKRLSADVCAEKI